MYFPASAASLVTDQGTTGTARIRPAGADWMLDLRWTTFHHAACPASAQTPDPMRACALLFFLLASLRCGGPPAQIDAGCVRDFWLSGEAVPSSCPCLSSSPQPECQASDCVIRSSLWLTTGFAAQGYVFISEERGTFSASGAPLVSAYVIDGGTIQIDPPSGLIQEWTCTSSDLTTGAVAWKRATSMGREVGRIWDGGVWLGAPLDAGR